MVAWFGLVETWVWSDFVWLQCLAAVLPVPHTHGLGRCGRPYRVEIGWVIVSEVFWGGVAYCCSGSCTVLCMELYRTMYGSCAVPYYAWELYCTVLCMGTVLYYSPYYELGRRGVIA